MLSVHKTIWEDLKQTSTHVHVNLVYEDNIRNKKQGKSLFPFNELMNVLNEDDILTKMQWSSKLSGK